MGVARYFDSVENIDATADKQTEAKSPEVEETHLPIRRYSDDTEWKIVVPKGRRSHTKNVVEHEKRVKDHFLAQNKFVKV